LRKIFDDRMSSKISEHSRHSIIAYLYELVRLKLHDKSGVILRRATYLETVVISISLTAACPIFWATKSEYAQHDDKPDEKAYLARDSHFSGRGYLLVRYLLETERKHYSYRRVEQLIQRASSRVSVNLFKRNVNRIATKIGSIVALISLSFALFPR